MSSFFLNPSFFHYLHFSKSYSWIFSMPFLNKNKKHFMLPIIDIFNFLETFLWIYHICRSKRLGRLISRRNKYNSQTHQKPSVLCTSPFEKSPIKAYRFCVLPPLKNHPSNPIGFVYSPLWKITHQKPSVLCTPPFEKSPITTHRFCVLPPLKNHPSKPIGFVYSPLWKITVFDGRLFGGGRLFW